MKKTIFSLVTVLLVTGLCGCSIFGGGKKKETFSGAWKDHAKNAWNHHSKLLQQNGIPVKPPSKLKTHFEPSTGTLGTGPDRFPYWIEGGGKIGGYLAGRCNGPGEAVIAREGNGFWNINIGTHEVGHHLNNHAKCSLENDQHPGYMKTKGGMPHWPYWRAGSRNGVPTYVMHVAYVFADEEGNEDYVCLFVLVEGVQALNDREGVKAKYSELAASLRYKE